MNNIEEISVTLLLCYHSVCYSVILLLKTCGLAMEGTLD